MVEYFDENKYSGKLGPFLKSSRFRHQQESASSLVQAFVIFGNWSWEASKTSRHRYCLLRRSTSSWISASKGRARMGWMPESGRQRGCWGRLSWRQSFWLGFISCGKVGVAPLSNQQSSERRRRGEIIRAYLRAASWANWDCWCRYRVRQKAKSTLHLHRSHLKIANHVVMNFACQRNFEGWTQGCFFDLVEIG